MTDHVCYNRKANKCQWAVICFFTSVPYFLKPCHDPKIGANHKHTQEIAKQNTLQPVSGEQRQVRAAEKAAATDTDV